MESTESLTIERRPIATLVLDPANARQHGERNLDAIEASLRRFGQAEPLVVQASTKRVIGGNGRLEAMKRLGWTECDVVLLDVDDLEATALGIALNRSSDLAAWDEPTLAKLLSTLRDQESLDGVGYSEEEIGALLAATAPEPEEVEDPGPCEPPDDPVSRLGDTWLMGEHRLVCGDAGDAAVLSRALDGKVADLVWTDPPYGVSYVGKTADALEIRNDALGDAELEQFLGRVLGNAAHLTRPGGAWYVAAPAGPNFLPFAKVLTELGIWRQTLVWVKDVFVLGRSDYHYRHEAVFYGWKPGAAHREPPDRTHDTVWEVDRPKASPDHPTTKPVGRGGRAARMLALAHHIERLVDEGKVVDYAAVARLLGLTRARLTQLTKLVLLAPDIQERLLVGELEASERALRAVVCEPAWDRQFEVAKPA